MTSPAKTPPALGGLPLLGNGLEFWRDPVALVRRGHQRHGPAFAIHLGRQPAAVLIGPDLHRIFFEETDRALSMQEVYRFLIPMFGEDIFFAAGREAYLDQRQVVLPAFRGHKMAGYLEVMAAEVHAWLESLGDEGVFDVVGTFERLTMYVAAHAFLGKDFRQRLGDHFWGLFRDLAAGVEFLLPPNLPLPRFRRRDRARRHLDRLMRDLIAERRGDDRPHQDFLQTFLEATYRDGRPAPDSVLISMIYGMVFAGHETTAGHLAWGLVQLLDHPDYLRRVEAEVLEAVPADGQVTMDALRALPHLEWALKETERMRPVAEVLMRYNRQGYEAAGFHVPGDWLTLVSPAVAHRLPEIFAEPDRYDPLRFAPPREEDQVSPYALIGFGGAGHRCLGVNFAYHEMKIILALLLQRYELRLLTPNPAREREGTTSRPARTTRVVYRRRQRPSRLGQGTALVHP